MKYTHKCKHCNNQFESDTKNRKFCSQKCYHDSTIGKPSEKRIHFYTCEICGKEARKGRRFCSRECYYKVHKAKTYNKVCPYCDKEFIATKETKNNTYCCEQHRKDYYRLKATMSNDILGSDINRKFYVKRCKVCEVLFETKRADYTICSNECISEYYKTNEERKDKISKAFKGEKHPNYIKDKNRDNQRDKLCRLDRKYIFKLFKNKCFKCGNKNNLEIDHHVPLKRGGVLSITNSVLLCKSCNCSKNAKMPTDFYNEKEIRKLEKLNITGNSLFGY